MLASNYLSPSLYSVLRSDVNIWSPLVSKNSDYWFRRLLISESGWNLVFTSSYKGNNSKWFCTTAGLCSIYLALGHSFVFSAMPWWTKDNRCLFPQELKHKQSWMDENILQGCKIHLKVKHAQPQVCSFKSFSSTNSNSQHSLCHPLSLSLLYFSLGAMSSPPETLPSSSSSSPMIPFR